MPAQFTIAKYWKQPKCPSANEWIQKLRYIYTMEFYAAQRKKELIPFAQFPLEIPLKHRLTSGRRRWRGCSSATPSGDSCLRVRGPIQLKQQVCAWQHRPSVRSRPADDGAESCLSRGLIRVSGPFPWGRPAGRCRVLGAESLGSGGGGGLGGTEEGKQKPPVSLPLQQSRELS